MRFDDKLLYSHKGGNNAVDILRLVVWIANHMSKKGPGIAAGQFVTTGSWTGLHKAGKAKQVVTNFPGIGDVTVRF
jgi:2-keto-4-pentenoate hydratase